MSAVVVLDTREPPTLYDALEENPDVEEVMAARLEAADLSINGVGFERKTLEDYVQSMTDGRFPDQLEKLAAYDTAYILIEGDMADTETLTHTDMRGSSIRGHMASLTARSEHQVRGVIPCSNTAMLADYAVRLARKHTEAPESAFIPTGAVGIDEPVGKRMWACLPEVGPALAERLWRAYGSPTRYTPADDMTKVDGIASTTAEKIEAALWEVPE